ncbi:MAG TPA: phage/plasmid primase, P4 family [Terriglobia bacterium]|nr:phage/plasmid primase, P4 family [Terriglobia bacterium]
MAPAAGVRLDPSKPSREQQEYAAYFTQHPEAVPRVRPDDDARDPNLLSAMQNDTGNAERFACLYDSTSRYCHTLNAWLNFDGRRWSVDDDGQAELKAELTTTAYMNQAVKAKNEDAKKFARQCLEHHGIVSCLASARRHLSIKPAELDRQRFLLNCQNGTVDLTTGILEPHQPGHFITKVVHHDYRPDTPPPDRFLAFLDRIFACNDDLILYMQKVFGYALTGDVSERSVWCLFGRGSNGKTTLLETIRSLIAEYSAQLMIDSLMLHSSRESSASLSDLSALRGARFVTTSEVESGQTLAVAKLKYLTAGAGMIKTVRKYENPLEFETTHKLFLDANHRPRIRAV